MDLRPTSYISNHTATQYSVVAADAANAVIASNPMLSVYAKKIQYL
jgi:hypothetical protein